MTTRHPLPPESRRPLPDYVVDVGRKIINRHGAILNAEARALVLTLGAWFERGEYALAEDLPEMTAACQSAFRRLLVGTVDVGPFPRCRVGYYLTAAGLVWVREYSNPKQLPLFGEAA